MSLFYFWLFFVVVQMMTQRMMGSPRKHEQEDLHLQSCGALSSSPSMRRPKSHLPQTTSTSSNPRDSPTSEQSLECKETILWPLPSQDFHQNSWEHLRLPVLQPTLCCAADVCRVISNSSSREMIYFHSVSAAQANRNDLCLLVPCEPVPSHQQKW